MITTASFKYRWITLDVEADVEDGEAYDPVIYFESHSRQVSERLFNKVFGEAMDALAQERLTRESWYDEESAHELYFG